MKATAPRISDQSAEFYPGVFRTLNAGLEYTIAAFPALYRRALAEIKGMFSRNELMLVIDVFNGTMLTAGMAGQHVVISVSDGTNLDHMDGKWSIEAQELICKLRGLTSFQAACLELWANGFWYAKNNQFNMPNIDDHVEMLI